MKSNNENIIGERMKELRGAMSQRQAAACVGIKPQNWNVYENGQSIPGANIVIKMCDYFNVSADWLLGLSDDRGGSREAAPAVEASKTSQPRQSIPSFQDAPLLAEIASLKRRIEALESQPSFACS